MSACIRHENEAVAASGITNAQAAEQQQQQQQQQEEAEDADSSRSLGGNLGLEHDTVCVCTRFVWKAKKSMEPSAPAIVVTPPSQHLTTQT